LQYHLVFKVLKVLYNLMEEDFKTLAKDYLEGMEAGCQMIVVNGSTYSRRKSLADELRGLVRISVVTEDAKPETPPETYFVKL